MSLLTVRKWLNKRPIKRKSMIDDYEAKILATYMKYMIYYPNGNLINSSNLLGNLIQFELYKDMKILDIGACFGKNWCLYPKISQLNLEIVDQSLLNIKVTQQKLSDKGTMTRVRQMDYTALEYDSHFFDRVISKIGFQMQSIEEQRAALKEANRVVKAKGTHYVVVKEQSLKDGLYQLMIDFDHQIQIKDPFSTEIIEVEPYLETLYENVNSIEGEADYLIYDDKQCIALFLTCEDPNYIDYIVKRHLGQQFSKFLQAKFESQGTIVLKQKYKVFKCQNKKKQLKSI